MPSVPDTFSRLKGDPNFRSPAETVQLRLPYEEINSWTTWCDTILRGRQGVLLTDNDRTAYPEKGLARMAQGTLERILQEIKTLKPAELLQVQQAVQAQLAPTSYVPAEERVLQEMLQVGLLTEIKPRCTDRQVAYPLVPIQGKPLSETILEERR